MLHLDSPTHIEVGIFTLHLTSTNLFSRLHIALGHILYFPKCTVLLNLKLVLGIVKLTLHDHSMYTLKTIFKMYNRVAIKIVFYLYLNYILNMFYQVKINPFQNYRHNHI